jgi:hypothetical protein
MHNDESGRETLPPAGTGAGRRHPSPVVIRRYAHTVVIRLLNGKSLVLTMVLTRPCVSAGAPEPRYRTPSRQRRERRSLPRSSERRGVGPVSSGSHGVTTLRGRRCTGRASAGRGCGVAARGPATGVGSGGERPQGKGRAGGRAADG